MYMAARPSRKTATASGQLNFATSGGAYRPSRRLIHSSAARLCGPFMVGRAPLVNQVPPMECRRLA